jgi:GNAT superfamily N-acetyltransferase
MQIRKFTPNDYPSIVGIHESLKIVWPESPRDIQVWIDADLNRDPKCKHERFVAEADGKVVGAASFGNRLDDYDPHKFYINIEVLGEYRNQGIGSALYDRLMAGLEPLSPKILRTDILENQIQSYPFVEKRGFKEVWRETPVHLDLASFDCTPFNEVERRLQCEGITIKALNEIPLSPDFEFRIYELYKEAARHVPCEMDELDIGPYEDWLRWCLHDPSTKPEAFFLAFHGEDLIAVHELGIFPSQPVLLGGLLGTFPEFRGKGIALALMIRAIRYGQKQKLSAFKTCTASINKPMQALFAKLGFVHDPEWLQCQKDIIA